MKNKTTSALFTYIIILFAVLNVKGQNTFKRTYNQSIEVTSAPKILTQDSVGYKIYSILGLLRIDAFGNMSSSIKGYTPLGILCSSIWNDNLFSFGRNNLQKPFVIKSDVNFNNVSWARTYHSNYDTLSFRNLFTSWRNTLLYSGPFQVYPNGFRPEFGEIDTLGHINRSFRDSTIFGYCLFTYLMDSSTYLVGINSSVGTVLVEIDTAGNIIYQKRIMTSSSVFTSSVQNSDKSITIIGIENNNLYSNIFLLNYSLGSMINWAKEITLLSADYFVGGYAPHINSCSDGGYIITATSGIINQMPWDPNLELIRLNSMGDSIWSVSHGGISSIETGIASVETIDHGFLSFGSTSTSHFSNLTNPIPFIIKSDSLGRTSTNCQESYFPFAINNLTLPDSSLNLNFYPLVYNDSIVTINISNINNIQSLDGCSLSPVIKVDSKNKPSVFKIFPNPSKEKLVIQCVNTNCNILGVEIINLNGQSIKTFNFNKTNRVEIDIEFLMQAKYLLKISSEHYSETIPFIKE